VPDSVTPVSAAPAVSGRLTAGRGTGATTVTARLELTLLAVVIVVQLLPLVFLLRLPTQDGPSHQALAYAMRVVDRPEGAALRQYLEHNDEALPNWFVFFLQARALGFVSTAAAEKLLVAAYVVLLPLGLRYALCAVDRDAGFLAALGLPLTYNYLFGMGFLNFCWSLAAFCFALGFYLRRRERLGPRGALALALLVVWVYFCHPVTLVMLGLAVATLGVSATALEARATGRSVPSLWRAARAHLLWPLAAFLPAAVMLAAFVGRRLDRASSRLPLDVKAKHLVALYSLVSFDYRTLSAALGLSLLLATMGTTLVLRRRSSGALRESRTPWLGERSPWDSLLAVAALYAVVYFAAPSQLAGGGFVDQRLALFPPLVVLLWLGSGRWRRGERWTAQLVAAGLALSMVALLWSRWAAIDRQLADYVAVAERVEDGRTVLPLTFAPAGIGRGGDDLAFRVWPFVHAIGYVAGRRPIVDLGLYEAGEDYFPLRFRPALDPYRHLSIGPLGMEEVPPRVDIPGYEKRGGRVDYVLLWEPSARPQSHPATRELYRQLAEDFERTTVSPRGNAELWRRMPRSGPPMAAFSH
jgi:hypothetical protein